MPKQYPLRVNKHRALVLHFGLHPCCLSGSKFLTANGPLMTVEIIITEATRRTQREEMKEETQPRCLSALYCPSDNEGTHERLITRAVEPRGEVFKLISPKRVSRATILHVFSYVNNNKLGGSIQAGSASESLPSVMSLSLKSASVLRHMELLLFGTGPLKSPPHEPSWAMTCWMTQQ